MVLSELIRELVHLLPAMLSLYLELEDIKSTVYLGIYIR